MNITKSKSPVDIDCFNEILDEFATENMSQRRSLKTMKTKLKKKMTTQTKNKIHLAFQHKLTIQTYMNEFMFQTQ